MALKRHRVTGLSALSELSRLRKDSVSRGERAFLIGDAQDLRQIEDRFNSRPPDVATSITLAMSLDVEKWFSERRTQLEEDGCEFDESLIGRWPGELYNKGSISLHLDPSTQNAKREVFIGIAPVANSWQIPSAVGYGGWNECPDSVAQSAVARRWSKAYDGEIVGLSFDTIEWEVCKPPTTQAEAMKLAWEQFLFCEDIVTQGIGTINKLAATLLNSPYWFFWWD